VEHNPVSVTCTHGNEDLWCTKCGNFI